VNTEIAFLDERVRPDTLRELVIAHHLARALNKSNEHLQCTGADCDRTAVAQQQLLSWQQPKRAKRNRLRDIRNTIG